MANPKVYALIVGLDDYPAPVPKLQGCKNDAEAMTSYLVSRFTKEQLFIKQIYDKEATRLNILTSIEKHLSQAEKGDVALFYYAGHGSQEPAHEAFWEIEPNRKNQTLVCYDSRTPDGLDLADKELAMVLNVVAKKSPNLVVIIDACHSGGITRDIETFGGAENVVATRGILEELRTSNSSTKVRPLDSYYLLTETKNATGRSVSWQGFTYVIPTPRHVVLSGALASQTSKETSLGSMRRGVFTYSLIQSLKETKLPLNYVDLIQRVRALVANKAYDQTPQIDVEVLGDEQKIFLTDSIALNNRGYLLSRDSRDINGWYIPVGSLLGIGVNAKIGIYKDDALDLSAPSAQLSTGVITKVAPGFSVIIPNIDLDSTQKYRAVILSNPMPKTNLLLLSDNPQATTMLSKAFAQSPTAKSYIQWTGKRADATYIVYAVQNGFRIGNKADGLDPKRNLPAVPLTKQLIGYTPENAAKLIQNLEVIARWQSCFDLANPASLIDTAKIKVTFYQITKNANNEEVKTPVALAMAKDPKTGKTVLSSIVFQYGDDNNLPRFQVSVENGTGKRLYFALMLMSCQFGITPAFNGYGQWLAPTDAPVFSRKGKFSVDPALRAFGKKEVVETFKLFISNQEFNPLLMAQDDLEKPDPSLRNIPDKDLNGMDRLLNAVQDRSAIFDEEDDSSASSYDWATMNMSVIVKYVGK